MGKKEEIKDSGIHWVTIFVVGIIIVLIFVGVYIYNKFRSMKGDFQTKMCRISKNRYKRNLESKMQKVYRIPDVSTQLEERIKKLMEMRKEINTLYYDTKTGIVRYGEFNYYKFYSTVLESSNSIEYTLPHISNIYGQTKINRDELRKLQDSTRDLWEFLRGDDFFDPKRKDLLEATKHLHLIYQFHAENYALVADSDGVSQKIKKDIMDYVDQMEAAAQALEFYKEMVEDRVQPGLVCTMSYLFMILALISWYAEILKIEKKVNEDAAKNKNNSLNVHT